MGYDTKGTDNNSTSSPEIKKKSNLVNISKIFKSVMHIRDYAVRYFYK